MKIVSWDIGIKNLAYCILEEDTNNIENSYIIHNWNIINIAESNLKCSSFLKNENVICDKKVTNKCILCDKNYFFCNIHKYQIDELKQNNLNNINKINNLENNIKCDCLIKNQGINCPKKVEYSYNNKNYCKTHINQIKKKINNLKNEKITQNANKIPIEQLKLNMIKILDKLPELLEVDYCVIENQPAMKNPKMKAIADTLYTWFLIRGQIDSNKIKKVKYCSPSNKLKIDEDNSVKLLSNTKNDVEKYKLTKELAVKYCKQIIKNDEKNLIFFNGQKKKDDLADSLLQGIYYIKIYSKL